MNNFKKILCMVIIWLCGTVIYNVKRETQHLEN